MIWKRGWLQWLAMMNSYHCGRSLWEMGRPNMQEWLHAKSICKNVFVFVKFQNCFPNWQIDRYVLRWGGDLLNLQKWIPRKWKVKVFSKAENWRGILIDRRGRGLPICMSESMGREGWIDFEGGIIIKGFDWGADCIANENTDSGN